MAVLRDPNTHDAAAALRRAMVGELRDMDAISSDSVAGAFAAVPRHLFAPGEPLEAVYAADNAVIVKRGSDGLTRSCLSAAHIQAVMLEQAEVAPGMRVLEIGSGGCNAALIQELAGAAGTVTTVDIDPDIVARARTCLTAAGYDQVKVVLADAGQGVPEGAPYDRIIVTAFAWDLPPAWIDQLTEDGRIVVPLRLRGLTRSIAFDRAGPNLAGRSYRLAGFVPIQGSGFHREQVVRIDDDVALRVDGEGLPFDAERLRQALRFPRLERWSGAAFDLPDELELFLMTSLPQAAVLHAGERLVASGDFAPSAAVGVPVLIIGGSFAYRTKRPGRGVARPHQSRCGVSVLGWVAAPDDADARLRDGLGAGEPGAG